MFVQNAVILCSTVAKLFDSLTGRMHFMHFAQYFITCCRQKETARDAISSSFVAQIGPDKRVKFRDPHLTVLQKFHPKLS